MVGGKCKRQIILLNSICTNLSPKRCLTEEKVFWKKSNLEIYLVMFNVILKYQTTSKTLWPTFHASSRTKMLVEMILARSWQNMPRQKDFWLSLEECQFKVTSWRMEQSLLHCFTFTWTCGWFGENFIILYNKLRWSASVSSEC